MTEIVDSLAALRDFLLADSDVAAQAAARVYVGGVPDDATVRAAMPQACIVVKPAGGPGAGEGYQEWGRGRVDVYCYGASEHESWDVYRAVYGALKRLTRQVQAGVLLHTATALAKGTTGIDPDTFWPVTLSSFTVTASEVAAA